jgi:hypothetical protein
VPLFVWAMGSCMQLQRVVLYEILGDISSQCYPYSSPNLVIGITSLMRERVYLRSTSQDNTKGALYQILPIGVMI